ncbi:MAG: hypothetical protein R3F11_18470 [Verrucomicrobiales bacterium]
MKPILRHLLAALALVAAAAAARAQDSICAQVKIEIEQELTLERAAFEARMTISNGLPTTDLANVAIAVSFADEAGNPVAATSDPDNTSADFFIRLQDGSSIPGTIMRQDDASIKWLIIPARGASGARRRYSAPGRRNADL